MKWVQPENNITLIQHLLNPKSNKFINFLIDLTLLHALEYCKREDEDVWLQADEELTLMSVATNKNSKKI